MLAGVDAGAGLLAFIDVQTWLANTVAFLKVLIGFSIIIFVHELGHFLFAKWSGVRVDRFAIGFGPRLFGWRKGAGFTWGRGEDLSVEELGKRGWGETDYCFRALPIGGYVKMLGQDDIVIDDKTGNVTMTDDPRAFPNRPVGQRMVIVSAGVIFNALFAALLFMWIFLIGFRLPTTELGRPAPLSPADRAGLQAGDRVVEINGRGVDFFFDIALAEMLRDELRLKVERNGEVLEEEFVLEPEWNERAGRRVAGLRAAQTAIVSQPVPPIDDLPVPEVGDTILTVNGRSIEGADDVEIAYHNSDGGIIELTVEREDDEGNTRTLTVYDRPLLWLIPQSSVEDELRALDRADLLGFLPRRSIELVAEGYPAEAAGLEIGDAIVAWNGLSTPLNSEMLDQIARHDEGPIRILVARQGVEKPIAVELEPRQKVAVFGSGRPMVGLAWGLDSASTVVADVRDNRPAAVLNMPRGSEILSIDGQDVETWLQIVEVLEASAGRTVTVRYRFGGIESEGRMDVPSSIVNEANLPKDVAIKSIAGEDEVELPDGRRFRLPTVQAVEPLLRKHIGQEVTVEYTRLAEPGETESIRFTPREDNLSPWQLYVLYRPRAAGQTKTEIVTAHGNPLKATWMGAKFTTVVVVMMYRMMIEMVQQNIATEHVSGPIGIFSHAVEQAKTGFSELLFFLAFLSINLAVINFLPLPVVDGGVFLFLIIEKIRGKPLSLRTQMISTIVGLGVIILVFVLVTINDILRLVNA